MFAIMTVIFLVNGEPQVKEYTLSDIEVCEMSKQIVIETAYRWNENVEVNCEEIGD